MPAPAWPEWTVADVWLAMIAMTWVGFLVSNGTGLHQLAAVGFVIVVGVRAYAVRHGIHEDVPARYRVAGLLGLTCSFVAMVGALLSR